MRSFDIINNLVVYNYYLAKLSAGSDTTLESMKIVRPNMRDECQRGTLGTAFKAYFCYIGIDTIASSVSVVKFAMDY